jgi:host factor-I protein
MKGSINLQDVFLNQVRKDRTMITVFLISGYQIRGQVKGFDNYTIILDSDGKQQMIYKHAISTMIPAKEVNFMSKESDYDEDN